ncbi:MAG TPA: M48 family metalloprotease [Candidatus Dormibacteraeota bacterium]|jgi:predicted Zn-dependent protease|nr:M48 family metalloprotease [Candidatus Dormibacteraeota bacterium]
MLKKIRNGACVARRAAMSCVVLVLLGALPVFAQRTQLKPGWNLFSVQDDVTVGKQNAQQALQQLPMCNAPKVDAYLTQLGTKLVSHLDTHGATYPWEFHCVNDRAINAFALPGGYVFVNRGAIEAADNEAQLAGVMAHEISHVALRHGTNQASKAEFGQVGVGLLGALSGGGVGGALLSQLGSFAAGGVLLRYSRTAETQADISGTQVLYDSGYDPRAMAQFFEKLEAETKGKNPPEFFSDHPNPDHRVERVDQEIEKLGGTPANARKDSQEFEAAKREVMNLPVIKKLTPGATGTTGISKPAPPSANYSTYQATGYTLKYPDNWKKYGDQNNVAFAPDGGVGNDASGHGALAYGISVGTQTVQDPNALDAATQQLIDGLKQSNPNMKVTRQAARVRLNNQPALSTYLSNDSPVGGQETDWIITVMRPEGLVYFVCTAPQTEYSNYDRTFGSILDSVRFK